MTARNRIVVFTRFPVAGQAKTRLIPAMGADAAAALQRDMSGHTLLVARVAALQCRADLVVTFTGGRTRDMEHWLGRETRYSPPADTDLGLSMLAAVAAATSAGREKTVIIGSDCPELDPLTFVAAFDALDNHDLVIGPAADGGYYLIGMCAPHPALFEGMHWGESDVLAETLKIADAASLKRHLLPELSDVDLEADLATWKRVRVPPLRETGPVRISVIIPTLNEADHIEATLQALGNEAHEIIVVDGMSKDDTVSRAEAAGASVLQHSGMRAQLLNVGALHATGDILLFLHADTLLPQGYTNQLRQALLIQGVSAGAFSFSISHPSIRYRIVETFTNLRSRRLGMPYGDQGLFMSRERFHQIGGFADLPIMEDFEMASRLRRSGKVVTLSAHALTSDRRWRKMGVLKTVLINQGMILNYLMRRPPERLMRLYRREEGVQTS